MADLGRATKGSVSSRSDSWYVRGGSRANRNRVKRSPWNEGVRHEVSVGLWVIVRIQGGTMVRSWIRASVRLQVGLAALILGAVHGEPQRRLPAPRRRAAGRRRLQVQIRATSPFPDVIKDLSGVEFPEVQLCQGLPQPIIIQVITRGL